MVPEAGLASPPKPEPLELGFTSSEVFPALQAEWGAPFWREAPAPHPQLGLQELTPGSEEHWAPCQPHVPASTQT